MHPVLRVTNWQLINDDYTISVTAGTQDYAMPADFGKEVACYDDTNDKDIARTTLEELARYYPGELATSGDVERYAIWMKDSGAWYIKFHYKPASNITVAFPYIVKPVEMSSDSDTPYLSIGNLLETGALAEAYRYKRQFAKAHEYEMLFEKELSEYSWEQANQPNQITQLKPTFWN